MQPQTGGPSFDRTNVAALNDLFYVDRGNWASTLQHILQVDARLLEVDRVSYWRMHEEPSCVACEMAYQRTTGAFERGHVLAMADHPAYFAAIRRGPLVVADARSDPRSSSLREYLAARGISARLDFPVALCGHMAGILCHEHVGEMRQWTAWDEQVAATIARAMACALAWQQRTDAEEAARRAAFLDRASFTLGERLEVAEVARRAVGLVVPAIADASLVWLVEGGAMHLEAFAHATAEGRSRIEGFLRQQPVPCLGGPALSARVIARRTSILLPESTDEALAHFSVGPNDASLIRALAIQSAMGIPLSVGGHVAGAVTFFVARRHYGNDDLQIAEEFARRLAVALENARLHERARTAVRVRDEFIAVAAHELYTPVAALQLSVQRLTRKCSISSLAEIEKMSERIGGQVKRLHRLIAQMLDASRIAAKQLSLSLERIDLAALARDVVDVFGARLEKSGCPLTLHAGAPVLGDWDRMWLEQLVSSLLDNAVKFGAGKPIEVSVAQSDGAATLIVRDHGPGIPVDGQGSIFEAFERAAATKHVGGLGLGLFIAREIVQAHGGTLACESQPGEGATFTARLPRAGH